MPERELFDFCKFLKNGYFLCQLTDKSVDVMASLCCVRMNNFSDESTRPRDMLFLLKDTLSIENGKLLKACRSVRSSVSQSHYK